MITSLTKEQESQLAVYRDRWLKVGLDCSPLDRERAKDAVRLAYRCAGMDEPTIFIFLDSPLAGCYGSALLNNTPNQVWAQVRDQVCDQVCDQVGAQVGAQVLDKVLDQVRAQVRDQVWDQVWDQVGNQVWDQVWAQVRAQVGDQVWAQVGAQVRDQVRAQVYRCGFGAEDSSWLSFYSFFKNEIKMESCRKLDGLYAVSESCGWWWPFKNAVIITPKHIRLERDDKNRLHCETGPSLLYPDGFGIWAIHGVRVTRRIVEEPGTITISQIESEKNAEVRRVMIDRYGQQRYIIDSGAEAIHEDDYGVLYRKEVDGDEPIVMVKVVNSTPEPDGSFKDYWLRVPPDTARAKQAVAWSFGIEEDVYEPIHES